jgi:hypothetical protein
MEEEETHWSAHRGGRRETMAAAQRRSRGCGARPPSSSCTDEAATACSWPSTARHSGGIGVAVAVQPMQSRGGHHQSRRAQGGAPTSSPEQIEPLGLDPQWWSSGAMSAMGGHADGSQWSEGGAPRAEAEAPEGGGGSRRGSPELGEGRIGDASRQRS